jgi:DNA-binding NtrC family response regulator
MLAHLLERKLGYEVTVAGNGQEAILAVNAATQRPFSVVLLDINMPVMDGLAALTILRKNHPELPVIMLTAQTDTTTAVTAIKQGAIDFIVKPPEPEHLGITLHNVLRMQAMSCELSKIKRKQEGALGFADLIGYQTGLARIVAQGHRAALTEASVLIYGETGVGKELFAQAIHGESGRKGSAFIAVNCGAIPENLVESTLFGHEKGAFTGAVSKSLGKFREADGGTLFLDEVAELPPSAQVKLLRALQQREVEPVGAGRPLAVDVRIVAATHRDLREEVRAGRFREDLYFRLNVLPITIPPLRDRTEDIATLSRYFIDRAAAVDRLPTKTLSPRALSYLQQYHWAGNVRELENLMRRAVVLCDTAIIDVADLAAFHAESDAPQQLTPSPLSHTYAPHLQLDLQKHGQQFKTMQEIENETILRMLEHHQGNITHTATALGLAKSTFYRKLNEIKGNIS